MLARDMHEFNQQVFINAINAVCIWSITLVIISDMLRRSDFRAPLDFGSV